MNGFIAKIEAFLNTGLGSVVKAVFFLILAYVVASIVKAAITKLLTREKVASFVAKADGNQPAGTTAGYISKLVYLLVFLLFIPGIFGALGADNVSAPILGMLNKVWTYIPNVLAAGIILGVGIFIAKLVRQLLIPVFDRIQIDRLQEKAGIEVKDSARLSTTLAYIVYVLILIPIIIVALQTLKINAISDPAIGTLQTVFNFIPNIIVAALIILVGAIIARFAGQIVNRLVAATGVDSKVRDLTDGKPAGFVFSKVVGIVVQALIVVFFVVEGLNVLKLDVLSNIGVGIIAYLPKVLAALVIMGIAVFLANILAKFMNNNGLGTYAVFSKIGILVIGAFMVLNQLGIATKIVNSAFVIILAALGVAFAIAFGIGGRDFAKKTLDDASKKLEENKKK